MIDKDDSSEVFWFYCDGRLYSRVTESLAKNHPYYEFKNESDYFADMIIKLMANKNMKINDIGKWRAGHVYQFQTCQEVWQELNAKAMSHQLSLEQQEEVLKMLVRDKASWDDFLDPEDKERIGKHDHEEDPCLLDRAIEKFFDEKGYPNLVFVKNGMKGLKSIDGIVILPPVYEDICFTYDSYRLVEYCFGELFVVKKDGKWGVVDCSQEILIPFVYDRIFRCPESQEYYVLEKNWQQGLAYYEDIKSKFLISVPVEMGRIYYVSERDLVLFTRDGKWGWWWWSTDEESRFCDTYTSPKYDEIFIPYEVGIWNGDEYFYARLDDELIWILYWTIR